MKKLECRVGVGEWWIRSQGSVVSSWSPELEIFNAEAQGRRVRRGVRGQESGVSS